jgi:hypothetical protein
MTWMNDANKAIHEFIMKKVVNKYKNWIDIGHEIHLLK